MPKTTTIPKTHELVFELSKGGGGYPIGHVSTWKDGHQYMKVEDGKWKKVGAGAHAGKAPVDEQVAAFDGTATADAEAAAKPMEFHDDEPMDPEDQETIDKIKQQQAAGKSKAEQARELVKKLLRPTLVPDMLERMIEQVVPVTDWDKVDWSKTLFGQWVDEIAKAKKFASVFVPGTGTAIIARGAASQLVATDYGALLEALHGVLDGTVAKDGIKFHSPPDDPMIPESLKAMVKDSPKEFWDALINSWLNSVGPDGLDFNLRAAIEYGNETARKAGVANYRVMDPYSGLGKYISQALDALDSTAVIEKWNAGFTDFSAMRYGTTGKLDLEKLAQQIGDENLKKLFEDYDKFRKANITAASMAAFENIFAIADDYAMGHEATIPQSQYASMLMDALDDFANHQPVMRKPAHDIIGSNNGNEFGLDNNLLRQLSPDQIGYDDTWGALAGHLSKLAEANDGSPESNGAQFINTMGLMRWDPKQLDQAKANIGDTRELVLGDGASADLPPFATSQHLTDPVKDRDSHLFIKPTLTFDVVDHKGEKRAVACPPEHLTVEKFSEFDPKYGTVYMWDTKGDPAGPYTPLRNAFMHAANGFTPEFAHTIVEEGLTLDRALQKLKIGNMLVGGNEVELASELGAVQRALEPEFEAIRDQINNAINMQDGAGLQTEEGKRLEQEGYKKLANAMHDAFKAEAKSTASLNTQPKVRPLDLALHRMSRLNDTDMGDVVDMVVDLGKPLPMAARTVAALSVLWTSSNAIKDGIKDGELFGAACVEIEKKLQPMIDEYKSLSRRAKAGEQREEDVKPLRAKMRELHTEIKGQLKSEFAARVPKGEAKDKSKGGWRALTQDEVAKKIRAIPASEIKQVIENDWAAEQGTDNGVQGHLRSFAANMLYSASAIYTSSFNNAAYMRRRSRYADRKSLGHDYGIESYKTWGSHGSVEAGRETLIQFAQQPWESGKALYRGAAIERVDALKHLKELAELKTKIDARVAHVAAHVSDPATKAAATSMKAVLADIDMGEFGDVLAGRTALGDMYGLQNAGIEALAPALREFEERVVTPMLASWDNIATYTPPGSSPANMKHQLRLELKKKLDDWLGTMINGQRDISEFVEPGEGPHQDLAAFSSWSTDENVAKQFMDGCNSDAKAKMRDPVPVKYVCTNPKRAGGFGQVSHHPEEYEALMGGKLQITHADVKYGTPKQMPNPKPLGAAEWLLPHKDEYPEVDSVTLASAMRFGFSYGFDSGDRVVDAIVNPDDGGTPASLKREWEPEQLRAIERAYDAYVASTKEHARLSDMAQLVAQPDYKSAATQLTKLGHSLDAVEMHQPTDPNGMAWTLQGLANEVFEHAYKDKLTPDQAYGKALAIASTFKMALEPKYAKIIADAWRGHLKDAAPKIPVVELEPDSFAKIAPAVFNEHETALNTKVHVQPQPGSNDQPKSMTFEEIGQEALSLAYSANMPYQELRKVMDDPEWMIGRTDLTNFQKNLIRDAWYTWQRNAEIENQWKYNAWRNSKAEKPIEGITFYGQQVVEPEEVLLQKAQHSTKLNTKPDEPTPDDFTDPDLQWSIPIWWYSKGRTTKPNEIAPNKPVDKISKAKPFEVGHISHRADGTYRKVGPMKWVRVPDGQTHMEHDPAKHTDMTDNDSVIGDLRHAHMEVPAPRSAAHAHRLQAAYSALRSVPLQRRMTLLRHMQTEGVHVESAPEAVALLRMHVQAAVLGKDSPPGDEESDSALRLASDDEIEKACAIAARDAHIWVDTSHPSMAHIEQQLRGRTREHTALFTSSGGSPLVSGPQESRSAIRKYSLLPSNASWAEVDEMTRAVSIVGSPEAQKSGAYRGGVYTHNHPSGGHPSAQDLETAERYGLVEVRATSPDGRVWIAKRIGDHWPGLIERHDTAVLFQPALLKAHQLAAAAIKAAGGNVDDGKAAKGWSPVLWRAWSGQAYREHFDAVRNDRQALLKLTGKPTVREAIGYDLDLVKIEDAPDPFARSASDDYPRTEASVEGTPTGSPEIAKEPTEEGESAADAAAWRKVETRGKDAREIRHMDQSRKARRAAEEERYRAMEVQIKAEQAETRRKIIESMKAAGTWVEPTEIAKSEVAIGTVHTWKDGQQYRKEGPSKWVLVPKGKAAAAPEAAPEAAEPVDPEALVTRRQNGLRAFEALDPELQAEVEGRFDDEGLDLAVLPQWLQLYNEYKGSDPKGAARRATRDVDAPKWEGMTVEDVERQNYKRTHEHGCLIDLQGHVFHTGPAQWRAAMEKSGRSGVDFEKGSQNMCVISNASQHGAIFTHNHPLPSPPSSADIYLFGGHELKQLRATNPDGSVWVVHAPAGGWQNHDMFETTRAYEQLVITPAQHVMDKLPASEVGSYSIDINSTYGRRYAKELANACAAGAEAFEARTGIKIEHVKLGDAAAPGGDRDAGRDDHRRVGDDDAVRAGEAQPGVGDRYPEDGERFAAEFDPTTGKFAFQSPEEEAYEREHLISTAKRFSVPKPPPRKPPKPGAKPKPPWQPPKSRTQAEYPVFDPTVYDDLPPELQTRIAEGFHAIEKSESRDTMIANLTALWSRADEKAVNAGLRWYGDAHALCNQISKDTGIAPAAVMGACAALSPQNDWGENSVAVKWMAETIKANPVVDFDIPITKNEAPDYKPATYPMSKWITKAMEGRGDTVPTMESGQPIGSYDPLVQAEIMRCWSKGGVNTPNNELLRWPMETGTMAEMRWQTGTGNMVKAINILNSEGTSDSVFEHLNGHKVQNFYNAILTSGQQGLCIDTHALCSAINKWRPGKFTAAITPPEFVVDDKAHIAPMMTGKVSDREYGVIGGYSYVADVFRKATDKINAQRGKDKKPISYAQMQAILWLQWRNERVAYDAKLLAAARAAKAAAKPPKAPKKPKKA